MEPLTDAHFWTGAESPQPSNHTQAQGQSKYVHRQIRTWTKQYRASETESIPEMEELIRRLPALLPAGTLRFKTVRYCKVRIAQCSTVEHSSVQYGIVQYSYVQYPK